MNRKKAEPLPFPEVEGYQYPPIPESGYLRLRHIIGDSKADPPIPPIIPVGKSTWWKWVREGRAPQPVKLSARVTVWHAEDIRALVERTA